jgi:hypothetical protein
MAHHKEQTNRLHPSTSARAPASEPQQEPLTAPRQSAARIYGNDRPSHFLRCSRPTFQVYRRLASQQMMPMSQVHPRQLGLHLRWNDHHVAWEEQHHSWRGVEHHNDKAAFQSQSHSQFQANSSHRIPKHPEMGARRCRWHHRT